MGYSACGMVLNEAIAIICDILNMPPDCQPSSWDEHSQTLYQTLKEAVEEKLTKHSESGRA